MRTIETVVEELQAECSYLNPYNEPPKNYKYKDIEKLLEEILEIHKVEKEQIIKALEYKDLENLKEKIRLDKNGRFELFAGMPEYHYREGFSDGINESIEIVKRGRVE